MTTYALLPGTPVLRRHDGRVQVGLDPAGAVLLPAGCESALAQVTSDGADPLPRELLALVDAGLLVERSALAEAVEVARARRAAVTVPVVAYGAGAGPLVSRATTLLADAGLAHEVATPGPPAAALEGPALLVGVGQPDRELVDDWMRRGVPHVLVRMSEGRAVAGPFVDPGRSACLRCVDAHHTDVDPTWPLLVRQHAAACRHRRADDLRPPEPVDPLLAALALAWAVRDLASWAEGAAASLLSGTLTLDPLLADVEVRTWHRHPGCGCSWQAVSA